MFLASSEFREAAEAQSVALGFPAAYVLVPHPIQDRTDAELVALADDAYAAVLAAVASAA